MNRNVRTLTILMSLCFLVLFAQLTRLHLIQREDLQANPNNTRSIVSEFSQERGLIKTADGFVIAESQEVQNELQYERHYAYEDLYAHITGYFSFLYGSVGLERSYDDLLSNHNKENPLEIKTTINHSIQQKTKEALGNRNGSVVVLNPQTGEILAMWSYPSYNPNSLSSSDLDAVQDAWSELSQIPVLNDPRLERTYREIYFPGSTFKIVTAAAALLSDKVTLTQPEFDDRNEYLPPLTDLPLQNYGGGICGGNILEGLRVSCNSIFAELAAEIIGAIGMIETSERFGFNQTIPIDLPFSIPSVFPSNFGDPTGEITSFSIPVLENTPGLAQAGIGQFDVKATPLQMALVAAAVSNDGLIMKPYIVDSYKTETTEATKVNKPEVWKSTLPSEIARSLKFAMETIVKNGTANRMQVSGAVIGGKTGTAQVDSSRPDDTHGWVIGFAGPKEGPSTVAIAVLVESIPEKGQNTGGSDAAPIAQIVLEETLRIQGYID